MVTEMSHQRHTGHPEAPVIILMHAMIGGGRRVLDAVVACGVYLTRGDR